MEFVIGLIAMTAYASVAYGALLLAIWFVQKHGNRRPVEAE